MTYSVLSLNDTPLNQQSPLQSCIPIMRHRWKGATLEGLVGLKVGHIMSNNSLEVTYVAVQALVFE